MNEYPDADYMESLGSGSGERAPEGKLYLLWDRWRSYLFAECDRYGDHLVIRRWMTGMDVTRMDTTVGCQMREGVLRYYWGGDSYVIETVDRGEGWVE